MLVYTLRRHRNHSRYHCLHARTIHLPECACGMLSLIELRAAGNRRTSLPA